MSNPCGPTGKGWVGVDLDGTLSYWDHWVASDAIGEPIPNMLKRVRRWLGDGVNVRIFTARVAGPCEEENEKARRAIEAWCEQHLGVKLPITATKDFDMIELWDDRAVQVDMNTGMALGYSTRGLK